MRNPKISIVTPTYNNERFIAETIDSVLSQTYKNFELIIVDDNSSDNTVEIVSGYDDKRIVLVKNSTNFGAAYSRNIAIKKSTGDYIAFLDGDDLWDPNKLKEQLDFMQTNNIDFSCTDYDVINEDGSTRGILVSSPNIITNKMFRRVDYIGCLTVMYKKAIYPNLQIPNTIKKRNDYALWLLLSEKANCYSLHKTLSHYRKTTNSISSGSKIKLLKFHAFVFKELFGFSKIKSWLYAFRNALFNFFKKLKYHKNLTNKKNNKKIFSYSKFLYIAANLLACSIFYLFGSNKAIVKTNAQIMNAFNFSKQGTSLHVTARPVGDGLIDYSSANSMCLDMYSYKDVLHPYCELDSDLKISFSANGKESKHIGRLCSSPVYHDFAQTEYLGLPLYKDNSPIRKGPKNKAQFASYIPSSMADKMLVDLSLNNYDELLQLDKNYFFSLNGKTYEMSINNIYKNNDTIHWNNIEIVNDYYKVFAKNNKNAIFSYSNSIFNDFSKTIIRFDPTCNYQNIKSIVNISVLTTDNEMNFSVDNGRDTMSFNFSRFDKKTILNDDFSICLYVCFAVIIGLDVALLCFFKELREHLTFPSLIICCVVSGFMIFGEIFKTIFALDLWPFEIFNIIGNVTSLIFVLNLFSISLLFTKDLSNAKKD